MQERRRIAIGLMLVGLICLLASVAIVVNQRMECQRSLTGLASDSRLATESPIARPPQVWYWLLAAGILFMLFFFASLAMARFRRALLERVTRKPAPPTPTADVWQMHKLPEDQLDQDLPQRTDPTPDD